MRVRARGECVPRVPEIDSMGFRMTRTPILRRWVQTTSTALTLALGTGMASAGTLTMGGWNYGTGNTVNVTSTAPAKTYRGQAGGFKGTLSGLSDARFNVGPIEMYCVDLLQSINIAANTTYSIKLDGELGSTTFTIKPIEQVFDEDQISRLTRLFNYLSDVPTAVDSALESTALQLAIWNIVYDLDVSLLAAPDATFSDASTHQTYASDLLSFSAEASTDRNRHFYVMTSATRQDQLFWLDSQDVPEPASLALVAMGFGAIGVTRRRRS